MARPKADLDALTVPKDGAGQVAPPASPSAAATATKAYAHTLSLRLTAEQYQALRQHVRAQEDASGGRVTHQGVIEAALMEYLRKH